MNFLDLFGNGGSGNQGEPASTGAGDGEKGRQITDYLSLITGAYQTITGQGKPAGPAPAASKLTETKSNTTLYIGLAVAGLLLAFLLFKKR